MNKELNQIVLGKELFASKKVQFLSKYLIPGCFIVTKIDPDSIFYFIPKPNLKDLAAQ